MSQTGFGFHADDLTEQQRQAIALAVLWWRGWLSQVHRKQVFRLLGYAGTGKTTTLRHLVTELGVNFGILVEGSSALALAPTGRAAMILTEAGVPCSTIHSAIYRPSAADQKRIEEIEKQIVELQSSGGDTSSLEQELTQLYEYKPARVPADALSSVKLIVVEEASMVGGDLMNDLLSFGVPIIAVGDPGQLPPVKQHGPCLIETNDKGDLLGDVVLTEIHRQARDSGIIRLATGFRNGAMPCAGHDYGAEVTLLCHHQLGAVDYLSHDQIICYTRDTAWKINTRLRRHLGFEGDLPTGIPVAGVHEKIICTLNRPDLGIVNGQELRFSAIAEDEERPASFMATVEKKNYSTGQFERLSQWHTGEDGTRRKRDVGQQLVWKGGFETSDVGVRGVDHRSLRKYRDKNRQQNVIGIEATWAWALTCHKAQGGQFDRVLVHVELGPLRHSREKWLYTAATRARKHLTMVGLPPAGSRYV